MIVSHDAKSIVVEGREGKRDWSLGKHRHDLACVLAVPVTARSKRVPARLMFEKFL
jgi:hypothetical protein